LDWDEWKSEYWQIVEELGLDSHSDSYGAQQLEQILLKSESERMGATLHKLTEALKHPIIIAGAGPSLETDLDILLGTKRARTIRIVAADGATTLLMEKSILPTVILTDLDGDPAAIQWAMKNGSVTLIHAHGDNIPLVRSFCELNRPVLTRSLVWGTTQTYPEQLWNFGGFTDGDRAICLALHFQSPLIGLIGFDFGKQVGKYSLYNSPIQKSPSRKIEKFRIALRIISSSYPPHRGLRFNLTRQGEEIPGFPRTSFTKFWIEWNHFA
jgi:uncharacterized Rossmann fold enzyme